MPCIALKTAILAAREAGKILLASYDGRRTLGVEYKKYREPVTLVDFASNDAIIRRISKVFPNDNILSEESSDVPNAVETPEGKQATWIIDPLDGTTNYIAHLGLFAVAIARVQNGIPTLGVIYDPLHDELFAAERGKGATTARPVARRRPRTAGRLAPVKLTNRPNDASQARSRVTAPAPSGAKRRAISGPSIERTSGWAGKRRATSAAAPRA